MALIKNNAKVGSEIAVELSRIRNDEHEDRKLQDIASPVSISC